MFSFLEFLLKNLFLISHVKSDSSFPQPLSEEEEKVYLDRYKNGDIEARNVLIERNLRLVAHIAKKYASSGQDADDLISIGTIGLIKAISSFDPDKNTKLGTYAARCIQNEILMVLRSSRKLSQEVSLQETIGHDKEGNEVSLIDVLCSDEEDVIGDIELKIQVKKLYDNIKSVLTPRERQIIELRYGFSDGCGLTQREIAKELGISRSYVSRIEKKVIGKLAKEFTREVK